MSTLKWSTSHAVFVTEIDDQHMEIFEALSELRDALSQDAPLVLVVSLTQRLNTRIVDHFAHEERLMRAARYDSFRWHKKIHDNARRRAVAAATAIEKGDKSAGLAFAEYLTNWLHDHTRLADTMLGAFLRNHKRGLCKIEFQAGTKPLDSCDWVDSRGEKFAPVSLKSTTQSEP